MSTKIKIIRAQRTDTLIKSANSYYSPFSPQQNKLIHAKYKTKAALVDWQIKNEKRLMY